MAPPSHFDAILASLARQRRRGGGTSSSSLVDAIRDDGDDENGASVVMSRCREVKRVVDSKLPPGRLGRHDRHESRAALVLHRVLARWHRISEVPTLDELAGAAGMRAGQFKEFAGRFDHYLLTTMDSMDSSASTGTGADGGNASTGVGVGISGGGRKKNSDFVRARMPRDGKDPDPAGRGGSGDPSSSSELITRLGISVGGGALDGFDHCHGVAPRAQRLLAQVKSHMMNSESSRYRRDGIAHDLNKYGSYYAAACFHSVVLREQQKGTGGGKERGSGGKIDTASSERLRAAVLKVANLSSGETFDDVLRRVEDAAARLRLEEEEARVEEDGGEERRKRLDSGPNRNERRPVGKSANKKRARLLSSAVAERRRGGPDSIVGGGHDGDGESEGEGGAGVAVAGAADDAGSRSDGAAGDEVCAEHAFTFEPSPTYEIWKRETLRKAVEGGRELLAGGGEMEKEEAAGGGGEGGGGLLATATAAATTVAVTDREALDAAADDVLRRHGLL